MHEHVYNYLWAEPNHRKSARVVKSFLTQFQANRSCALCWIQLQGLTIESAEQAWLVVSLQSRQFCWNSLGKPKVLAIQKTN
jgi:hypothetical protein